jgi:hypothetical protein
MKIVLEHSLYVMLLVGCGIALLIMLYALLRRIQREDSSATRAAAICRAQSARTQGDPSLAEADRLLARITARAVANGGPDAAGQVVAIQAELTQIQQRCASDLATRARLELLRLRIDRLGTTLRGDARALESN